MNVLEDMIMLQNESIFRAHAKLQSMLCVVPDSTRLPLSKRSYVHDANTI